MRLLLPLLLFAIINCVSSKNNVKALTESNGQEIIEIGTPIKELPPDLEEEPSAENYEEDKPTTIAQPIATKKDVKKSSSLTTADTRRKNKETTATKEDDEEARIEKELAEIYKDNLDYKDSSEVSKEAIPAKIVETEKPILRTKAKNFKFQPDLDNKAEVERFRTSVDEISCDKTKMKGQDTTPTADHLPGSSTVNCGYLLISLLSLISVLVLNY